MESNVPIVTATLTRKFSQNSPKKDPLSPRHSLVMNEKSNNSEGTSLPAGFCTTPRLKKANSLKYFGTVEGSMPKLGHILRELYDTEIEYVNSLGRTVHIYLNGLLKQPIVNIKIICYKIFGNIQDILHFHQDVFLPRLEEAYHSAGEVSALLLECYEVFMKLYVKYCLMICESSQLLKSKTLKSIFKTLREDNKDKRSLSGYLILPVQRITRYELILNEMINTYHKANIPYWNIEKAYAVIKEVPTLADNAMRLNSILKYKEHFNVKHLRQLRLHNIFIVSDRDKRFSHKKYYVYLMVDRVIFTKICCDISETELLCTFKSELFIEEDSVSIKHETLPDKDPRIFVLQKGKKEIYMQAEKIEIKEKWVAMIKELVNPTSPIPTNPDTPIPPITPIGPSPPPYDEYWNTNEQQSSNTDDENNEDVDSDLVDMKHYIVVEDFNPDETMNGFIALRKGQIYEPTCHSEIAKVQYKELSHWYIILIGHIDPSSSEYWSGFEGFAYSQFLKVYSPEGDSAPENSISPVSEQKDEQVTVVESRIPLPQEKIISRKPDLIDPLIESTHIYSPHVPKRNYNKTGISKLSSSLTRKLQMNKTSSKQSDRQSITEEEMVFASGYESARSSLSQADSITNDRDTFYSVTSDSESDHVQRSDSPEIGDINNEHYSVFLSSSAIRSNEVELNGVTISTTPVMPPVISDDRVLDRNYFGQLGEQVLQKYSSREELNADIPPDGREENPILDDLKTFGNRKLSPHHKSDSIPANLDRLERDCDGSSRKGDKTRTQSAFDKLTSRVYTPLKRSSSDQSKKIFRTQLGLKKSPTPASPIEVTAADENDPNTQTSQSADELPEEGYSRKRSNSIHKIIERFNSCSSDTSYGKSPKRSGNFKRHSYFVSTDSSGLDDEIEDKYKTMTPQNKRPHTTLQRTLSFDKDSINYSDFITEIPSPERPGSTDTLKNSLLFDLKSPQDDDIDPVENSMLITEIKPSVETHTLKIDTSEKTQNVSPEPYKLPIKITTKKVISTPLPPAIKPKPKVNVRSYASNTIMGNFEMANFNQIFDDNPHEIKKKAVPPPIRPKNKNLVDEYKLPIITKPLKNMSVPSGRLADICFEIGSEIENLQVDWYKDSLAVSTRRYHTSINGRICALKIWDFGEFDQATYEAVIKSRGGQATTKCEVKLSAD